MRREPTPQLEKPTDEALFETLLTLPGSTGETYNRFHRYSQRNIGFLALQGCAPEPVATYNRWKELGRQVRRGEKAYSILRPIQLRIPGEEVAGIKVEEDRQIRRFKVVRALFSYGQTEGDELPPYEPQEWSRDRALGALGINLVNFEQYDGNIGGYAYGRNVAINPMAPYPLRTLLHEMSHVEHGHTTPDEHEAYKSHRGPREFEAEASAFLTLNELGALDDETARVSRGYCQGWMQDQQPTEQTFKKILNVSTRVLTAGYEEVKQ